MELTIMGYILIPIGILMFVLNYEILLYCTVFFSGFTGSSLLNLSGVSLQPAYYFFILFLIRYLFEILRRGNIVKPNILLSIFVVISLLSLMMPYILDGSGVVVLNPDDEYSMVKFTSQNMTQYMYLLFGFFTYWIGKDYITKKCNFDYKKIINIFLWSSITICILGIYQQIAYVLGLPFDELFRQGIHGNIQTYEGFVRVYSVFVEPSMYSIFLILCMSISIYIPKKIFRHKGILILLILINGIMSTSSTFLIGTSILIFIFIIKGIKFKYSKEDMKINFYLLLLFVFMIISILLVAKLNSGIIENIINGITSKLNGEGASATSRSFAFKHHIEVALKYPLLGVGFGSVRSYDLMSTWLSSVGIIAVFIFVLYLLKISIQSIHREEDKNTYTGYSIGLVTSFILMFISVPEPYALFIWISMAILEVIKLKSKSIKEYRLI